MKTDYLRYLVPVILTLSFCLCSCTREKDGPAAESEKEITISGLGDDHWTYFSFDTGMSVGTSRFLSDEEDKAWASRTDWDFAICGDYIKTNGGTSGNGLGGMQKDTVNNYLNIVTAPEDGYSDDVTGDVK